MSRAAAKRTGIGPPGCVTARGRVLNRPNTGEPASFRSEPPHCEQFHEGGVTGVVAFVGSVARRHRDERSALSSTPSAARSGTPLTWGEAMVAATYVFFLMFWVYGVVPHQWLTWAQNELKWRSDAIARRPRRAPVGSAQVPEGIAGHHEQADRRRHHRRRHLRRLPRRPDRPLVGLAEPGQAEGRRGRDQSRYGRPLVKA